METPDGMRQFITYHRKMFALMGGICLAILVVLGAVVRDNSLCAGFACGAAAQLIKFGFLDIASVRQLAAQREKAAAIQLKTSFLSLLVFGLALVPVYLYHFNIWAFAAGIFIPRIVLIADTYFRPNPFVSEDSAAEEAHDA